jgi:MoaA/NifB/PqqE/SkfB family radical SAM enzyme
MDPYEAPGAAPYRIDCALTYHLPNDHAAHWAPLDRVARELTSEEWGRILEKAWNAGVPHVIFTGGEPTMRPDLCQLVAVAERLGMVTGLITDGLRLAESKYLHELLQSGLDHVMIVLDPAEEQSWEGLRDTLVEDIAATVHLTLRQQHHVDMIGLLERLAGMGVKNISFSADSVEQKEPLLEAQRLAAEQYQMHLVWDLPAPYSQFHPVAIELAEAEGSSAVNQGNGRGWLYIEPDGDVLTGQGQYQAVLGNMLIDDWAMVWQKANLAALHNQQGAPEPR